jgi:predicted metalloprotease with PDZ domain
LHYAQARFLFLYLQHKGLLAEFYKQYRVNVHTDPSGGKLLEKLLGKPIAEIEKDVFKWIETLKDERGESITRVGGLPPPPRVADISANLLDTFGARIGEGADGLRVLDVRANTVAAKAGLQPGDIITQINGGAIAEIEDLKESLQRVDRAKAFKIEVTRRGNPLTLSAQF